MVKFETSYQTDRVFAALGHGTRRGMTEIMLRDGPKPISALADPFGISLPGAMKHIGVLEEAGIVSCRREGRQNICSINAQALEEARGWFEFHQRFWNASLDRLGAMLERRKK